MLIAHSILDTGHFTGVGLVSLVKPFGRTKEVQNSNLYQCQGKDQEYTANRNIGAGSRKVTQI